ncbi:MAG TPA: hypothetical protein PLS03_00570 [Terrimicrobiaceae bacterium]|nr:hypothetical protein [Terrimicrobiaceae bacterium]
MSIRAQTVLKAIIDEEFPNMSVFAKTCGVTQSLVWRDCEGRQISDKRFLAYMKAISPTARERLVRARVSELLPAGQESLVKVRSSGRLKEDSANFALLSPVSQTALNKLAGAMANDQELHDWVMQFIRKVC